MGVPLLLAACGLSERPYEPRRQWPLLVPRPIALPPRPNGRVLLLRTLRAGPGLDTRGLRFLQPDGSLRVDFFEEWAVPPAEGVEDALRRWLAASGRFAAVIGQGSRMDAGWVMEGELLTLWAEPAQGRARAVLSITLIANQATPRILLQRSFAAEAPLAEPGAPAAVQAQLAALAQVFTDIEKALP